jgi:hypothetical protein
MDQKMCFTEHIDAMVGKALAMLKFIKRGSTLSRLIICSWCAQSLNMRVVVGLFFMMYTSKGLRG